MFNKHRFQLKLIARKFQNINNLKNIQNIVTSFDINDIKTSDIRERNSYLSIDT